MSETVHAVGFLNLVAFVALGVISLRGWLARRDPATGWAAATFGVLGAVVLLARVVPQHPHGLLEGALLRFLIVLLVVFPYFLFRFTNAFGPPSRRLFAGVSVMTVALSIWTFALPDIPQAGEPRSARVHRLSRRLRRPLDDPLDRERLPADPRRPRAAERRALADADARGRGGDDHPRDHPGGGEQRPRLGGRARPGLARAS